MSTTDKYNYTDVYDDGTVVCRERKLPRKEIPENEMRKKRLLFQYHFEGPDHPYAIGKDWVELEIERGVTASQLKKIIDNPDIDAEAREAVKRRIERNDLSNS